MKLITLLCAVIALLLLGGFAYFAVTDVPVTKSQISKTISNERFF